MSAWLFIRTFWKPIASVAIVLLAWLALHHYGATRFSAGYQQATSEMQKQLDAYKAQAQLRITQGARQHEIDSVQLAALRSEPHPSVVCHRAPQVRPAPRVPEPDAAGDRTLPPRGDESPDTAEFNPTEALYALADEADEKNAACRMLNMAVHGMPSAP